MKKKTHFLVFSLLLFGVLSCKKDKTPPSGECIDFKFAETSIVYSIVSEGRCVQPCFNPNNSNEFVYYYFDVSGNVKLKKYNILTQQNSEIVTFDKKVSGQPKWGKNGWIAFTSLSGGYVEHIYVVKENGDSLRQFTENTHNLYPFWDDSENPNLYWAYSPNLSETVLLKQNLNQTYPDTVGDYFGASDVLNMKWLHSLNPSFGYHNLNDENPYTSDNFIHLSNFTIPFGLTGLCWFNNNSYFFFTSIKDGLYQVNSLTGQKNKLISFCDSKRYETISCSSNGKYLVAERVDSTVDHEQGKIFEKRKIYLINLQTLEEIEILLN